MKGGKKILLIEDDLATIEVYETIFKKAGFEVEVIKWGEEALNRVKEIEENKFPKPDVVLLDLILPDINGIEVLKEIRKNEKTKDLLVFILTNYTDVQLEKMGYSLGSERYLLKTDYTPSQLIEIIEKSLKRK